MTEFNVEKQSLSGQHVKHVHGESGKVGYLVLWLMGAPAGLLLILYLFLGNNLFGAG